MRTLIICLLLLVASISWAQIVDQEVRSSADSGYVTTAWKKIYFSGSSATYAKIIRAFVYHDTTDYARTPYLQYAFENDTTNKYVMLLRPGEWRFHEGLGISHVYVRASTGTVPYRVQIER